MSAQETAQPQLRTEIISEAVARYCASRSADPTSTRWAERSAREHFVETGKESESIIWGMNELEMALQSFPQAHAVPEGDPSLSVLDGIADCAEVRVLRMSHNAAPNAASTDGVRRFAVSLLVEHIPTGERRIITSTPQLEGEIDPDLDDIVRRAGMEREA